jgi:hypothetical protein
LPARDLDRVLVDEARRPGALVDDDAEPLEVLPEERVPSRLCGDLADAAQ